MAHPERHDEFVDLVTRHRSQLFGYIYGLVHNLQDTEDLYQNTCLILWRKFDQYRPGTKFVSWACEVARWEVSSYLRKKRGTRRVFSEEVQVELAAIQPDADSGWAEEYRDALTGCLGKLSARDHRLVELCYGDAISFKEIAEQLDRSPKSVYDALSRIRRALLVCIQRALGKGEGEP